MKKLLDELLEEFGLKNQVKIKFIHIPPYSPKMNAAEYFIQIIRKRFLKNMVPNQNMEQVLTRLLPNVNHKRLLTQEQMRNILTRIKRIITQKKTTFIVE